MDANMGVAMEFKVIAGSETNMAVGMETGVNMVAEIDMKSGVDMSGDVGAVMGVVAGAETDMGAGMGLTMVAASASVNAAAGVAVERIVALDMEVNVSHFGAENGAAGTNTGAGKDTGVAHISPGVWEQKWRQIWALEQKQWQVQVHLWVQK